MTQPARVPLRGRGPRTQTWGGHYDPKVSGGDIDEATPDPIPNSEVKLVGADGTAREAVWESRTLPGFFYQVLPSGTLGPPRSPASQEAGLLFFVLGPPWLGADRWAMQEAL